MVLEINRIYAHGEDKVKKKVKNEKQRILDELNEHPDDVRGLFYDISIAYDLWLKNEPSKTTEGNTNGKN